MIGRLASVAWLLVVWLALVESVTPGAVAGGLVLGVGLTLLFPERDPSRSAWTIRPLRVVGLAAYFTAQFLHANLHVAMTVIAPTPARLRRGVVGVPVVSTSRTLRAVLANAVSLTPGTFIVDHDEATSTMYVHVLDMATPDTVRLAIHRLERVIALAFAPRDTIDELDRRIEALTLAVASERGTSGATTSDPDPRGAE